jgi:hypothetical protein
MLVGGDVVKNIKSPFAPDSEYMVLCKFDSVNGNMYRCFLRRDSDLQHKTGYVTTCLLESEIKLTGRVSEDEFNVYRDKLLEPMGFEIFDKSRKTAYENSRYGK